MFFSWILDPSQALVGETAIKPSTNNLLAIKDNWGPSFKVTMELFVNSVQDGCTCIIHFTDDGGDGGKIGRRIPALFLCQYTLQMRTHIGSNDDYGDNTNIESGRWIQISFSQHFSEVR